MTFRINTLLVAILLLALQAPCAEPRKASVLRRQVDHFSFGETTALNALLWFGHDEGICFGIEFSGQELNKKVRISLDKTTVGDAVRKILSSSDLYVVSAPDGIVLIRKKGVPAPAWLDHRLRKFEIGRTELMSASSALWMTFQLDLNPSLKGFAGDYPGTEPPDEIGPIRERGKTIRQLLIKIVAASRGASWYPTQEVRVTFPTVINNDWTLASYSVAPENKPK